MARKKSNIPDWIAERLRTIRCEMSDRSISAYLLTQRADHYHATGFTGEDSAVLITARNVHVISDGRFSESIDEETPWAKKHLRKGQLVAEIRKVCTKLGLEKLAVQHDGMTVATFSALRKAVKPTRLVKAPDIVNRIRATKDAVELRIMGKAIDVAQEAFRALRRTVRVGQTERELAARLEYEMSKRGSTEPAFGTIVACDANASRPHAHAGSRKVKKGGLILIDWGATIDFYRSDLTRCLFVDKIPAKLGEVYRIVLDAQLAAIEAVRPGARMCDVDAVARKIIAKAGYQKQFSHGLGHGLGIDVHEPPSLSWRSEAELEPGMVVTVEPGVYLPGVGGIRIEDDVLVTQTGHNMLSHLEKDLQSALI